MSWLDKIKTQLRITCGDGISYFPDWIEASKQVDYNFAEFTFPDVEGSLVIRRTPRGTRYQMEIFFQGGDNIDTATAFEKSSRNQAPWRIDHPFYGTIYVQPVSLYFDDSQLNLTKIRINIIETILLRAPVTVLDPVESINIIKSLVDDSLSASYDVVPLAADISELKRVTTKVYSIGSLAKAAKNTLNAYRNAFTNAINKINNATAQVLQATSAIQGLLNMPFQFESAILQRTKLLVSQFEATRSSIEMYNTKNLKRSYELMAGQIISALAVCSITASKQDFGIQEENSTAISNNSIQGRSLYANRSDAEQAMVVVLDNYNQYIADLDSLQSANGSSPDSYIPDFAAMNNLAELVLLIVSQLVNIGLGSRQERIHYCEEDTNIILLTHRFYGLASDENLEDFKKVNKIGLNELLQIKKGRKIVYYI